MVFQPIVSLDDFQVFGYEVLTRVSGERHASIVPLLRQAEKEGFLAKLESHICQMILSEGRDLIGEKLLFINMEAASFFSFLDGAGAEVFGSSGSSVVLEVTEHGLMRDAVLLERAADRWRELGIRLAVDDIASGYDRLRSVLRLKPEFVKFDRELIHNCHVNVRQKVMIRGLQEIVRALGASVIAEGVETFHEVAVLKALGVPIAQGYFFSEPVPAARLLVPLKPGNLQQA